MGTPLWAGAGERVHRGGGEPEKTWRWPEAGRSKEREPDVGKGKNDTYRQGKKPFNGNWAPALKEVKNARIMKGGGGGGGYQA